MNIFTAMVLLHIFYREHWIFSGQTNRLVWNYKFVNVHVFILKYYIAILCAYGYLNSWFHLGKKKGRKNSRKLYLQENVKGKMKREQSLVLGYIKYLVVIYICLVDQQMMKLHGEKYAVHTTSWFGLPSILVEQIVWSWKKKETGWESV